MRKESLIKLRRILIIIKSLGIIIQLALVFVVFWDIIFSNAPISGNQTIIAYVIAAPITLLAYYGEKKLIIRWHCI